MVHNICGQAVQPLDNGYHYCPVCKVCFRESRLEKGSNYRTTEEKSPVEAETLKGQANFGAIFTFELLE